MFMLAASLSTAEMMPVRSGTVRTYHSSNGAFQARVTYGSEGMASLDLYKGDEHLWEQHLMYRPGDIAVANNGQKVVATTFGWKDEGGSDGVLVFDEKGEKVKEIRFGSGDLSDAGLKWIDAMRMSDEGNYIAIAEGTQEDSLISLYDTASGDLLWEGRAGYNETVDIAVSPSAENTFIATRKDTDMAFTLLDKDGRAIKTKSIEKNFSYDVPVYVRFQDGQPQMFDLLSGTFKNRDISVMAVSGTFKIME
jgi:DNA-binding beta-propeller fold protein YncE